METTRTTPLTETIPRQQLGDCIVALLQSHSTYVQMTQPSYTTGPSQCGAACQVFKLAQALGVERVDSRRAGAPAPRQAHPGLQRGPAGRQRDLLHRAPRLAMHASPRTLYYGELTINQFRPDAIRGNVNNRSVNDWLVSDVYRH